MSKRGIGEKIKLSSYEDMFGTEEENVSGPLDSKGQIVDIPIPELHTFKNHPFRVVDDEAMDEMVESIKEYGVLVPAIVRPREEGGYEILSGHRRHHASTLAGMSTMPASIKECNDDEATVIMVDANIQREDILISEKALAYQMKYEAMKHQGVAGGSSLQEISEQSGESMKSIQRLICIASLNKELLDMVDSKRLQFTAGVEISYIDKEIQQWICEYIHENGNVKQNQIVILRQELLNGAITQSQLIDILNENAIGRIPKKKVTLSEKKLSQYFPPHYTSAEMEKVIVELLTNWKEQGGAENGF